MQISTSELFSQPQPPPSGFDVVCVLKHFAIITYLVDIDRIRPLIPRRFELETLQIKGRSWGLLSIVPFEDDSFRSAVTWSPSLRMTQTNYRIYIIDTKTHQKCVWFLGTSLDSWAVFIPRFIWKLPWHPARIRIDCQYHSDTDSYSSYQLNTTSNWAPAQCQLSSSQTPLELPFFDNIETGLVTLTHPFYGFYYRRDQQLGSYHIWHDRLPVHSAQLHSARFDLLDRLNLVSFKQQQTPHSVLLLNQTEFMIYLPPRVIKEQQTT